MKKLLLFVSLSGLLLGACSTPEHLARDYPEEYGLFVATTNIFANSNIYVQKDGEEPVPIKVNHVGVQPRWAHQLSHHHRERLVRGAGQLLQLRR
jgi:hypothetical protein